MFIKTISVSALNNYIKKSFDADFILNNLYVKGEISNIKIHSSGHIYFSLKDSLGKINCVMFKYSAMNLKFTPKNGDKVVIQGKVSVYEKEGSYQLYCNEMKKDGIGDLYIAFEELKSKLKDEGYFDYENKKPIPEYPEKIGVVTSPTGAAIRDIINVSTRRNSRVNLLIYPSLVQGERAAESIIKGIEYFNKEKNVDVIVLARGGGSIEELWAFNEEILAKAIFNSKIPIVTGVGHETDFTIADFVSDERAPTPSAAAELVTPNIRELNSKIESMQGELDNLIYSYISEKKFYLEGILKELKLYSPENYIVHQYELIDNLKNKLNKRRAYKISIEKERLQKQYSLLNAHNPLNILNKGYSIIEDTKGNVIATKEEIKSCNKVNIRLKDGNIKANIKVLEE